MYLTIDGSPRQMIPIKDFRATHNLPPDFGVAYFEPKDYDGLGRIDHAGAELNSVRTAMLDALPQFMPARNWLTFLPDYARLFESQLYGINAQVGLKDVEIEFAVAGLSDVCQAAAYALLRFDSPSLRSGEGAGGWGSKNFFHAVYNQWLDNSLKVFTQIYPYARADENWQVQIFAHAYGRAGLVIHRSQVTYYVYDPALGCPAEGFMAALLGEIAARMLAASAA
ncbi:MAG: hypothetical protein ABI690_29145 [Chloroflexota bacterium]